MTTTAAAVRGITGTVDYRPVASYGRISKRRKGDGGGAYVKIENQHADNTEYIHKYFPGAPIAYYDDNMSAWDPNKVRPDWERMMEDVRAGNLRACVAWHADRYTRQPGQLETFWDACKTTSTQYHTVRGGHVTNPLMLRIEGALAANDSDLKSEKVGRRFQTMAQEGKAHGGRRRFGYEKGMETLHPVEAPILADMCERFVGGESLNSLANELAAKGITGTSGGTITGPNLRKILGAPHIAGLRTHNGKLYPGSWPAIIDRATHEIIVDKLANPSRRTSPGNARVHLLSGLMTCAVCGAGLRGRPNPKKAGRVMPGRSYACSTGRHCYRPTVIVDEQVRLLVVARLAEMDASGVFTDNEALQAVERLELEQAALATRRKTSAREWAAGTVSDAEHNARTEALDELEAETLSELATARAAVRPLAALEGMTGPEAEARWAAASLDKRRAVISILFESLELVGANGGRRAFVPEDVRFVWRETPGSA
jgi:DNA invertase Pin-like site-specific DNA recombinase